MRKLMYSTGSPYARKVRILLIEKGLEYESDVQDVVRPIEEIRRHNPALQVPVLYDQGRSLFGSNLIVSYIYATYPNHTAARIDPPLAPSLTRPDRHWDDMLIFTAIESMADALVNVRFLFDADPDKVSYISRQRERIASCLDWLEARMTRDGFWPGMFSMMDANLMCPLLYGEKRAVFDYRSGRWPAITAMIDRLQSRPSIAATPVGDFPPRK